MGKVRLDQLLVARGLAESRAKAQAAILAGGVKVAGALAMKPSALVDEDEPDIACAPAHPWVSRGGVKLAYALDAFGVDPNGRACLDLGASTGGFTDVLLARGALRVVAVDVGAEQMHPRLRADPRVIVLEKTDARTLSEDVLAIQPSLIVADLSFIGLAKALPAALGLAAPRADLIALVKPQFEAGPDAGKKGVLPDDVARVAAEEVIAAIHGLMGFAVLSTCDSPIRGGDGNLEILVHARRG